MPAVQLQLLEDCVIDTKPSQRRVSFPLRRAWTQVAKILLDYDENSEIITYDQKTNEQQTYKGVEVRQRNRTSYHRLDYTYKLSWCVFPHHIM